MITIELLSLEGIRRQLRGATVGQQLYLYGEVDSTNSKLRALARGGARDGTVVLAEGQTAGRGRRGQVWFSPSGVNLYASVLFRPALRASELMLFALVPALAVADAARDLGVSAGIKWPNDVLANGKKFAGSLIEAAVRTDGVEYVIVGVGVNLNVEPWALKSALGPAAAFATSLAAVTGGDVPRNAFAAAYLNHLDSWSEAWKSAGPGAVRRGWADRDILTGRRVMVRGVGGDYEGRVLGIDDGGRLVVHDSRGDRHALGAEEIRLVD